MDEAERKNNMIARYVRGMKREVDHEERKARQKSTRARKSGRSESRDDRRRHYEADDDPDEPTLERMGRVRSAPPSAPKVDPASLTLSTVVAVHQGRVGLIDGRFARLAPHLAIDRDLRFAVGDAVRVSDRHGQARVEALEPRRSVLARQDPAQAGRPLILAANVDLAVIVIAAADPPPRPGLVDRFLLALQVGDVAPALCVNKVDLCSDDDRRAVEAMIAPYSDLDIPVSWCSAATGEGIGGSLGLAHRLREKTVVFAGHSGVGKSSLLNALDPDGERVTGEVRSHDGRGRHTTTSASMRDLGNGTRLIDTPGIRALGLDALSPATIRDAFLEFAAVGRCRFGDCTHVHEPECAVRHAVEDGNVPPARYASYLRLLSDQ